MPSGALPRVGTSEDPFVLQTHSAFVSGLRRSVVVLVALCAVMALAPSARAQSCAGDLNGDGVVNGADLGLLLSAWGSTGAGIVGDLNADGVVDGADLGALISAWG